MLSTFVRRGGNTLKNCSLLSSFSFSDNPLSEPNINPCVKNTEYAVRGPIVIRAGELQNELKNGNPNKLPFNKIIMCNIGNPQELGQQPLTFNRQVLSACLNPQLIHNNNNLYPNDVIDRAKYILDNTPSGTIGCYTHSQGFMNVRQSVANYITARDNTPNDKSNPDDIFLTDGASPGIKYVLQCISGNPNDGVLIPIPQYPLYSATISLLDGQQLGYYLNESNGWSFELDNVEKTISNSKENNVNAKAIVIINPGNPTGQCISDSDIEDCIKIAKKENLIILADEVYQENIYNPEITPFHSFRKVLLNMSNEYKNNVSLISFHSISKGILGECGLRGGYMELLNINDFAKLELYKLASINLCPNTIGQITIDLMCNRPKPNDPSYDLYNKEYNDIYNSLKRRAVIIGKRLNAIKNMSCQNVMGAMYAFPSIVLNQGIINAANKKGVNPDAYYCLNLLEKEGICVVPGSGFGQKDGTYHFRTTLLPPENEIEEVCDRLERFHNDFLKQHQ